MIHINHNRILTYFVFSKISIIDIYVAFSWGSGTREDDEDLIREDVGRYLFIPVILNLRIAKISPQHHKLF